MVLARVFEKILALCLVASKSTGLIALLMVQLILSLFEGLLFLRRIFGSTRDQNGENYVIRSLMICTPNPILFG